MIDQAEGFNDHASVSEVAPIANSELVQKTEDQSHAGEAPPHPNSAVDADSIVNRKTFGLLVEEIGKDAAHEFLTLFVNETESRLKMLRHLSFDADRETIMIEAHSLKSAAASFGLQHLSELARALERESLNINENEYHAILNRHGRCIFP